MGAVAEGSPSIRAQANLSALGLHEMAASLPDYVRMVAAGERGFASALEEMTRVEVAAREVRITNQRIRSSGFPYVKGLADFDWDFQPSVPRAEIEELATLRFVERAENVLFVGSPGVGKTHLAVALGIEAVRAGREVRFVDCARLVEDLEDASSRGILKKRLKYHQLNSWSGAEDPAHAVGAEDGPDALQGVRDAPGGLLRQRQRELEPAGAVQQREQACGVLPRALDGVHLPGRGARVLPEGEERGMRPAGGVAGRRPAGGALPRPVADLAPELHVGHAVVARRDPAVDGRGRQVHGPAVARRHLLGRQPPAQAVPYRLQPGRRGGLVGVYPAPGRDEY